MQALSRGALTPSPVTIGAVAPEKLELGLEAPDAKKAEAAIKIQEAFRAFKADLEKCPLTFEPLFKKRSTTTPCGHTFRTEALAQWTHQNSTCPICRTNIAGWNAHNQPFPQIQAFRDYIQNIARNNLERIVGPPLNFILTVHMTGTAMRATRFIAMINNDEQSFFNPTQYAFAASLFQALVVSSFPSSYRGHTPLINPSSRSGRLGVLSMGTLEMFLMRNVSRFSSDYGSLTDGLSNELNGLDTPITFVVIIATMALVDALGSGVRALQNGEEPSPEQPSPEQPIDLVVGNQSEDRSHGENV